MRIGRWNLIGALVLSCAFLLHSAPSEAANLPVKKAPPKAAPTYAPPLLWNGGYYGIDVGYTWGRLLDPTSLTASFDRIGTGLFSGAGSAPREDGSGWLIGSHVGINYRNGSLLYGVEADLARTNLHTDAVVLSASAIPNGQGRIFAGADAAASVDWYGTLRGRIGFVAADRAMFFVTAGVAMGKVDLHAAVGAGGSTGGGPAGPYSLLAGAHDSSIKLGWVLGTGLEFLGWNNTILRVGYYYVDLGDVSASLAVSATGTDGTATAMLNARAKAAFHVIRAGITMPLDGMPNGALASIFPSYGPGSQGWAGWYAGAHLGGVFSSDNLLNSTDAVAMFAGAPPAAGSVGAIDANAAVFGLQTGYNFQSGPVVYGFEIDTSFTKLDAASGVATADVDPAGQPRVIARAESGVSVGWLSSLRGRLGVDANRAMIYATAGLASGRVNFHGSVNAGGSVGGGPNGNFGQFGSFDESRVKWGWTVGAGVDYQLSPNLIFNLGYQYYDLGNISASRAVAMNGAGGTATGIVNANAELAFHVVKAGLNWRR